MPEPVLLVVGGASPTAFPGFRTFFSICGHVGLSLAHFDISPIESPGFLEHISTTRAVGALCLGRDAFTALTGRSDAINSARGYIFSPSDLQAFPVKEPFQIGTYQTNRKLADGTYLHRKGDPKMGHRVTFKPRPISPTIEWIIPTLDPSSVQGEGFATLPAFKADLARVRRFIDQPHVLVMPALDHAPLNGESLTLDIETVGFTGPIHTIGLATDKSICSLPWSFSTRQITQGAIDAANVLQGHNLAFDIPRLEADGISFASKRRFDTLLCAALLNPDLPRSLEYCASLYLDVAPWKFLNATDPTHYNARDAFNTHQIAQAQRNLLDKTGMTSLFCDTIMPATEVLIDMTRRGIRIDLPRLSEWQQRLSRENIELSRKWAEFAPNVNTSSPAQLKKFLYKDHAFPVQYAAAKKGAPPKVSTDEEAIRFLRYAFPQYAEMFDCLLALKKNQKAMGTYASVDFAGDECVHPNYLPTNRQRERTKAQRSQESNYASTGRIASSDPNIQNQTLESKKIFIPHYPGWSLLEFDFSQIELRIAAQLSEDKALQEALKGDVHARTMEIVGCDRVRAKNLIYGSVYGAGPRKLARVLRSKGLATSEKECAELQDALARAYPRLWGWRYSVANEGAGRRFLTNPFGRRRYFYAGNAQTPEMFDYLPQSTAADILWRLLIPLRELAEGLGGHFLTTTHDSGLFEFPEITKKIVDSLREVCECEWPQIANGFRVPIKLKAGRSWGELNPLEESSIQVGAA